MERKGKAGLAAAVAVALAGAGLMLGLFAAAENSYAPLETLPPSLVETGVGHPDRKRMLDINTATQKELESLPGIGPAKAAAIIAWRRENGPFRYPEELLEVPGIGEKTLKNLINLIKAGGD